MRVEKDIERKVKQKEEEIQQLREGLYKAEAYLEALQESLRLIRKTTVTDGSDGIRPGSLIDKARKVLRRAGKPMYVGDMLNQMGKEVTKNNRASLSGSLGNYVRQDFVFTRPAPNTFGLKEFDDAEEGNKKSDLDDLPVKFGTT